jgi:glyoxylase-like metal-dependent hydrolase (beta-lactamase superfamily II)
MLPSSRRELLRALITAPIGASFTVLAGVSPLRAQAPTTPIKATKLADHISLLTGDGGNIALVTGNDGLLMVDGGYLERAADLLKAAAEVDPHRVTIQFNTHWHLDHIGANEALGAAGAKIMAHANTKKWLGQRVVMEAINRTVEPLKPEGLPTEAFTKAGVIKLGTASVEYTPVAPAHTDGDAYLFFPDANMLHTGDLLFNGTYPLIDYSTGGWIGGMVAACDALLKQGNAETRIIPGHGPMASKGDLKASRDMLATVYERLEKFRKEGKPAKEVVAAAPTKDFDEKFGKGMKPDQFVEIAYTGLLRHAG